MRNVRFVSPALGGFTHGSCEEENREEGPCKGREEGEEEVVFIHFVNFGTPPIARSAAFSVSERSTRKGRCAIATRMKAKPTHQRLAPAATATFDSPKPPRS
jgi:hypothetical protein